jgi:type III secretion protein D
MDVDEDLGGLTIGTSSVGDVLLADGGIAKVHCRLSLNAGSWQIEPVDGAVFDRQGNRLAGAATIARGQRYRLANVWIGFCDADDAWDDVPSASGRSKRHYPRAKASLVAAAAVAVLAIPAVWFVSTAWGRATRAVSASEAAMTSEPVASMPAFTSRPASPAKLAEDFSRALAERELRDRLELRLLPGHWEIRGALDPEEQQRFERLLVRFTETRKPNFPIKVTLLTPAELLPFRVVEVISGKSPSVVTDDGERLQVGDTHQGWRLSTVEPGKVVFVGKQRVEISL